MDAQQVGALFLEVTLEANRYYKDLQKAQQAAAKMGTEIEKNLKRSPSLKFTAHVDDSQLTNLNKHLNLKDRHFERVGQKIKNNPITPTFDLSEVDKGIEDSEKKVKQFSNKVSSNPVNINFSGKGAEALNILFKERSRTVNVNVKTNNGLLGNILTGVQQGVGQSIGFGMQRELQLGLKRNLGIDASKAMRSVVDASLHPMRTFFSENGELKAAFAKAGETLGTRMRHAGYRLGDGIVAAIEEETIENKLSAAFQDATKGLDFGQAASDAAGEFKEAFEDIFGALFNQNQMQKFVQSLSEGISAYRTKALEERAIPLVQARAAEILNQKRAKNSAKVVDENTKELFITTGGYAGSRGLSGERIAKDINSQNIPGTKAIWVKNTETDITQEEFTGDDLKNSLGIARSLAIPNIRGYSKDAIEMAAQALAAHQRNPQANLKLFGESGGGFVAEEASKTLDLMGIKNTFMGSGTPTFIGGLDTQERKFLSPDEEIGQWVEPFRRYGLEQRSKAQSPLGVKGHTYDYYAKAQTPQYQKFMYGLPQPMAKEQVQNLQKMTNEFKQELGSVQSTVDVEAFSKQAYANMNTARLYLMNSAQKFRDELEAIAQTYEELYLETAPRSKKLDKIKQYIVESQTYLKDITENPQKRAESDVYRVTQELKKVESTIQQTLPKATGTRSAQYQQALKQVQLLQAGLTNPLRLSPQTQQAVSQQVVATPAAPTAKNSVNLPELDLRNDDLNLSIGKILLSIPELDLSNSDIQLLVGKITLKLPELILDENDVNILIKNIILKIPQLNLDTDGLSIDVDKINLNPNDIKISFPNLELTIPDLKISPKDIKFDVDNLLLSVPELTVTGKAIASAATGKSIAENPTIQKTASTVLSEQEIEQVLQSAKEIERKFSEAYKTLQSAMLENNKQFAAIIAESILRMSEYAKAEIDKARSTLGSQGAMGTKAGDTLAGTKGQIAQKEKGTKRIVEVNKLEVETQKTGQQVVSGLEKGVEQELANVQKLGEKLSKSLIDSTEDELGIQSPSKVFEWIGQQVVAGFELGVKGLSNAIKIPDIASQAGAIAADDAVTGGLQGFAQQASQSLDGLLSKVSESTKKIPLIGDAFSGVIDNIKAFKDVGLSALTVYLGVSSFQQISGLMSQISDATIDAARQMEQLQNSIRAASGGILESAKNIEFLTGVADKYRTDLKTTLELGVDFLGSVKDTPLEGEQSRRTLEAVTAFARSRGLGNERLQRGIASLGQIQSKGGDVSQEEIKQQLAEALSGSTAIIARSQGVSVQELNKMIASGLDSEEVIIKFTQQLQGEVNAVGNSFNDSVGAVNNFNNAIFKLQANVGKELLPLKNFSLDAASKAIEIFQGVANNLLKILGFLSAKALWDLGVTIKGFIQVAIQLGLAAEAAKLFGQAVSYLLPQIKIFAAQFLIFQSALKIFDNLKDAVTDFGGDFRSAVNQMNASMKDFDDSLAKLQGRSQSKSNPFLDGIKNAASKAPEILLGGSIFGDLLGIDNPYKIKKQVADTVQAIQDGFNSNKGVINKASSSAFQSQIGIVQDLDKQLKNVQGKRRALVQLNPSDVQGLKQLQQEEQVLLKEREKQVAPVASLQADLQARIDFLKKSQEQIKIFRDQGKVSDDFYIKSNENILKQLAELEQAQIGVNKRVGESATAFKNLQINIKAAADDLADSADRISDATNKAKAGLANQVTNGSVTPGNEQVLSRNIDQSTIKQQIQEQLKAVSQTTALLNTEVNKAVISRFGVAQNTGKARLTTLAEQTTNSEDKFVLEQLSGLQDSKLKLSDLRNQLAQSRAEAQRALVDQTKQVADYYRNIARQAEETALETKRLQNQINTSSQQNKLKKAILGIQDNIVTQFVDSIVDVLGQFNQASDQALDAQSRLLQNKNQFEDQMRQSVELSRSLPGQLPKIPVELDLSGIQNDANIEAVNSQIDNATTSADGLKAVIDNSEKSWKQNSREIGNFESGIDKAGTSISEAFKQLEKINNGLIAAQDNTEEWTKSLLEAKNTLASTNAPVANTQPQGGVISLDRPSGANDGIGVVSSGATYGTVQPFKIVEAVRGRVENVNTYEDLEVHHPSRGNHGKEAGRAYQRINDRLEEVIVTRFGNLIKKDFVLSRNGNQNVDIPSPVNGVVSKVGGNIGQVQIRDLQGRLIADLLHMVDIKVKEGQLVSYGMPLGKQGGAGGYAVHAHIALFEEQFKKYIADLKDGIFDSLKAGSEVTTQSAASSSASRSPQSTSNFNGGKYASTLNKLSPEFLAKSAQVANNLGTTPENLLAVMGFETGGTFSPSIKNSLGYTGLIQFSPKYSPGNVGKTTDQLAKMSPVEQLGYVEKYINKNRQGKSVASLEDLYMSVLMPSHIGKGGNAKLPGWAYKANKGLDIDRDGAISVSEATQKVRDYLPSGQVLTTANAGQAATPQAMQGTVAQGMTTQQSDYQQRTALQRQKDNEDNERAKIDYVKTYENALRTFQRSGRDLEDQRLAGRRGETDLKFSANPNPSPRESFKIKSTEIQRKYDDEIKQRVRDREDAQQRIVAAERALQEGALSSKEIESLSKKVQGLAVGNLTTNASKAINDQLQKDKGYVKELDSEINTLTKTRKEAGDAAYKIYQREEQLRRQSSAFEIQESEINGLKQRIDLLKQVQEITPSDPRLDYLPDLERQLSFKEADLELDRQLVDAEKKLHEHTYTPQEYQKMIELYKRNNIAKQEAIELTYKQRTAEQALNKARRTLQNNEMMGGIQNEMLRSQSQLREYGIGSGNKLDLNRQADLNENSLKYQQELLRLQETEGQGVIGKLKVSKLRPMFEQRNQLNTQTIEEQYKRQAEDEAIASQERLFRSQQDLLSGRSGRLGRYGVSDRNLEKQTAINEQNFSYEASARELDRLAAAGGEAARYADQLRANLDALNQIKLQDIQDQFNPLIEIANTSLQSFQGFFSSMITGSESIGDAFKSLISGIASNLANLATQLITNEIFSGILGGGKSKKSGGIFGEIFGGLGGSGGILNLVGGLFYNGGYVPNYARGHNPILSALHKEHAMTGRKPYVAVLSEGERVLNIEETRKFGQMGGDRILQMAQGGVVGASANNFNSSAITGSGIVNNITVNFNSSGEGEAEGSGNGDKFGKVLKNAIVSTIITERRPGGSLYGMGI